MRTLVGFLIVLLLVLQYRLWVGEGSLAEVHALRQEVDSQRAELDTLQQRNNALRAEVKDLKKGLDAVEERARSELGMIRDNEEFYQIIDAPNQESK
ncbi:MAG: cell division protein FtsB [Gammaproteobacteria bacterium]|nr:cell division protein FtsB [Gammaproteobacteria bacterium]